jgi:hypothetical protein
LHLSYEEDIVADPLRAYSRVCEFVGIEPAAPRVDLVRTNPFSYDAILDNVDEVRAVLKDTKYAWMLDN